MENSVEADRTKETQTCSVTRCMFCDIVLAGRIQFIGHMIHNHDLLYEQALEMSRPLSEIGSQSLHDKLSLGSYNYNYNNNNNNNNNTSNHKSTDIQKRATFVRAQKW